VKWRIVSPYLQFNSKAFIPVREAKETEKGRSSPQIAQMRADSDQTPLNTEERRKRRFPWIALGCRNGTCPRSATIFIYRHNQSMLPAVLLNGRLERWKPRHGLRCLSRRDRRGNERGEFPLENAQVWSGATFQAKQARMRHESVFISHKRNRTADCRLGRMCRRERGKFRTRYGCSNGKKEQLRREKNDAGIPLRAGAQELP